VVREACVRLYERLRGLFFGSDEELPLQVLGELDDSGLWSCRFCSRSGIQKKYPDLFRHVWSEHYWVMMEDETEEESVVSESRVDDFSVGDHVDDYSLPDSGSDEEDLEIQEATGGLDPELKKKKLRSRYSDLIAELRKSGSVEITEETHYGGLRGKHIVRHFKAQAKRMDLEFDVRESNDRGSRRTELIAEF